MPRTIKFQGLVLIWEVYAPEEFAGRVEYM